MNATNSYTGNSNNIGNNFAKIECLSYIDNNIIPFIVQGFKRIIFTKNKDWIIFKIYNLTKHCMLFGLYDSPIFIEQNNICTSTNRTVIKPNGFQLIKIPSLTNVHQLQFYTISCKYQDLDLNSYIPSSSDEYLPFWLTEEFDSNCSIEHKIDYTDFNAFQVVEFEKQNTVYNQLLNQNNL